MLFRFSFFLIIAYVCFTLFCTFNFVIVIIVQALFSPSPSSSFSASFFSISSKNHHIPLTRFLSLVFHSLLFLTLFFLLLLHHLNLLRLTLILIHNLILIHVRHHRHKIIFSFVSFFFSIIIFSNLFSFSFSTIILHLSDLFFLSSSSSPPSPS